MDRILFITKKCWNQWQKCGKSFWAFWGEINQIKSWILVWYPPDHGGGSLGWSKSCVHNNYNLAKRRRMSEVEHLDFWLRKKCSAAIELIKCWFHPIKTIENIHRNRLLIWIQKLVTWFHSTNQIININEFINSIKKCNPLEIRPSIPDVFFLISSVKTTSPKDSRKPDF